MDISCFEEEKFREPEPRNSLASNLSQNDLRTADDAEAAGRKLMPPRGAAKRARIERTHTFWGLRCSWVHIFLLSISFYFYIFLREGKRNLRTVTFSGFSFLPFHVLHRVLSRGSKGTSDWLTRFSIGFVDFSGI